MPRPAKRPAERRSQVVRLRLSAGEWEEIRARAGRAGLTPSAYLREAGLNAKVTVHSSATDDRMVLAINRVGVNLNQLVRHCHTTGAPPPPEIKDLLARIRALVLRAIEGG